MSLWSGLAGSGLTTAKSTSDTPSSSKGNLASRTDYCEASPISVNTTSPCSGGRSCLPIPTKMKRCLHVKIFYSRLRKLIREKGSFAKQVSRNKLKQSRKRIPLRQLRSILAGVFAVFVLISGPFAKASPGSVSIQQLRCEYLSDPMGIDAANPRLSWILTSEQRNVRQTAYQILVASSPKLLGENRGDLWDTGKVASDQTAQIAYQGLPLTSRELCYWKVHIWDQDGRSVSSPVGEWEIGR